ncbi:family 20 glycosylhydrolase [Pseudoflavitalea sp. G-6-1-2]|uniref:family 20 glycosylhydrolase n=1 Tax=Pseudoflavitalea sp. G-6-1-2 TaxID=2728841 RepID=UPI00146C2E0F|nr:family 20 glycosylhydrolase [Pseudoflavitalea sp. G-6-1-2]NML19575.1 family 20 glycosylhydrolase [Pseudoflavitalea sp. G-6-1-2]
MRKFTLIPLLILLTIVCNLAASAQQHLDTLLPVRGFCIVAPKKSGVDAFANFITKELAPRGVNTLILRVDYNYEFQSHPELRDTIALSKADVKKLVAACRQGKIRVIPQINLLGHQSWAGRIDNLLRVYPQFDETPHVKMPEKYVWPNADGLYCKSYCPLHPDLHKIVFDLVDEVCDVFEADAFHAGMDEVFYLGDDSCKRCSGRDKAELYAGEVRKISDHLRQNKRELWIWGDRLIDGKTTGIGMWEGSFNNTHRAIDLIPKDVFICDWHYERPDKTPVLFAAKGLRVATCPWRTPANAVAQLNDMISFRKGSTPEMKQYFQGMIQTVWSGAEQFMDEFYGKVKNEAAGTKTQPACFRALFDAIQAVK